MRPHDCQHASMVAAAPDHLGYWTYISVTETMLPRQPYCYHSLRSGRTALLFHYAYSRAATGEHIVFITRTKAVEREPPVLPAGVTKDDEAFGRIHMRWTRSSMLTCMQALRPGPVHFAAGGGLSTHPLSVAYRYLETLTDIRKFVASLHILEHPPAALIVDDLAKFEDEM